MSPHSAHSMTFARAADCYLRHHRALGVRYHGVEWTLSNLQHFLMTRGADDLDEGLYESWRRGRVGLHCNTRRKAEQIVRRFCLYRRFTDRSFFVPDVASFTRPGPYIRPVIVEPQQIAQMLEAADRLPVHNKSPMHSAVGRVATVLLYTTGLRSSELRRLRVEDINEMGDTLYIRKSKFHKARFVPLSSSAQIEIQRYVRLRATFALKAPGSGPLLCNRSRREVCSYSESGFRALIERLFHVAGIRDVEGRRPRIHDLRHSFAVHSLLRSYRAGCDPQALLPKLSLYLGHSSIESTMHYLRLVPATAHAASQRFEAAFAGEVLGGLS